MSATEVLVYGGGGFAREVAWLASDIQKYDTSCQVMGFVDDDSTIQGTVINNLPVLSLYEARDKYQNAKIVAAIGAPRTRQNVIEKAQSVGFEFITLVHPRVEISEWVEIGNGTVICAGNIMTTNITLGEHVQINLDCTVGHDVVMGKYTTLAPGVHVSGWVHMGKRVYIGTGAVILNGTENKPLIIEDDAVIGAGACVTKSVPAGTTVVGIPAKPLKR